MKLINSIYLAISLATTLPVKAQQLSQEITVEHEIVPVKREALRLGITPLITLPAVETTNLNIISRGVNINLLPEASLLGPVESPVLQPDTTHIGYVALGYFPLYNLAGSAGISGRSRALSANAWIQFDGHNYKRDYPYPETNLSYRRNTLSAGGRAAVKTAPGTLSANVAYTADWYNTPKFGWIDTKTHMQDQSFDSFTLGIGFATPSKISGTEWHADVDLGLSGYGKNGWCWYYPELELAELSRVKESTVTIAAGVKTMWSEHSSIGLDASFGYQRDNRRTEVTTPSEEFETISTSLGLIFNDLGDNHSLGVVTLRPYWTTAGGSLSARIGATVQLSFYSGANSGKLFHIAPDVTVAWSPDRRFTVYAKAGGGEYFNTLTRMHAIDYQTSPMMSYGLSHIPLTLEGGFTAGPWSGAALRLYARYASANEWMMPADISNAQTVFLPVDMRGGLLGAEFSYSAGRTLSGTIRYEMSPDRSYDRGWYMWRDRARQALEVNLSVRPVEQLTLSGSWQLRDRRISITQFNNSDPFDISYVLYERNLGVKSNLSLGASWAFNDDLNMWIRCENILGRKWYDDGFIPVQGFHGLVGASYQF